VGAVIVKSGRIVSRGHHRKAGTPHAEAIAIAAAKGSTRGADLYTTLEPCNHFGRTPPCSQAILDAGIRRVVYGSSDPNPLVNGKGIARLRRAGVEVVAGVLAEECDALNRPFFKWMKTRMPFVSLKAAITLDGKLASATGDSRWVTGEAARLRVHELRNRADAILVGAGTVEKDDPQLTTRIPGGKNAVRVIVDSTLRLSPRSKVFRDTDAARTIVATLQRADSPKAKRLAELGVEVWNVPARRDGVDLQSLLRQLGEAGLLHVFVEGGAEIFSSFLKEKLADELLLFIAPKIIGASGISWAGELGVQQMAKALKLQTTQVERVGEDILVTATLSALGRSLA
jgi:diaminohydroxyphosphoribosylaminopyrimidine deaminase/5-amino-6-(5-phosphoribosylamino)uracil reductase